MWHSGPFKLKTCPVLAFREWDSEIYSVLRWFRWTYRLQVIPFVGARWEREGWPADGAAGAQDAWLTSALEIVADVYNALAREAIPKKKKKGQTEESDDDDDE